MTLLEKLAFSGLFSGFKELFLLLMLITDDAPY